MQFKSKNRKFLAIGLAIFLMIFGIWNVGWAENENVYAEDIIPEFADGDGTAGAALYSNE
ncbi:MAG: hypothetical protein CVU87_11715 [Firmicutes bacterium HGW-Firmicutes-12]|jgi:hypothetical protein|nr:MAG: hypothetical protein CVU87_11715 [Firmicutes bacterium HGW-Firmicutes-12]